VGSIIPISRRPSSLPSVVLSLSKIGGRAIVFFGSLTNSRAVARSEWALAEQRDG
jgi:hypothetical protein